MPWETFGLGIRLHLIDTTATLTPSRRPNTGNTVNAIYGDREGNLWVGDSNDGLSRLRQGLFTSYTQQDGLADNITLTVLQDSRGNIWIGSTKGLNLFRDGKFRFVSARQFFRRHSVYYRPCRGEKTALSGLAPGIDSINSSTTSSAAASHACRNHSGSE